MNGLDLYAKIEHLFDFEYVMEFLWDKYIQELKALNVKRVLDIGCGSGGFMLKAKEAGFEIVGIDISEEMVKHTTQKGLEAYHKDLCDFSGEFDACVAIFDVINYMNKEYLKEFLGCVKNVLKKDGYFLFDVNTLHGFEDIAQGTLAVEDENIFGVLDSVFENSVMETKITVFEKDIECYKKEEGSILQYFHKNQEIKKITTLKFDKKIDIHLYSDFSDKNLLVFKNN